MDDILENKGLFKITVVILTTCRTQYTWGVYISATMDQETPKIFFCGVHNKTYTFMLTAIHYFTVQSNRNKTTTVITMYEIKHEQLRTEKSSSLFYIVMWVSLTISLLFLSFALLIVVLVLNVKCFTHIRVSLVTVEWGIVWLPAQSTEKNYLQRYVNLRSLWLADNWWCPVYWDQWESEGKLSLSVKGVTFSII